MFNSSSLWDLAITRQQPNIEMSFFIIAVAVGNRYVWKQGLGNNFQVEGARATRKLPTSKFKFLLGFRPLYFESAYARQKKNLNIFKVHFFRQSWRGVAPSVSKLEGRLPRLPLLFPRPWLPESVIDSHWILHSKSSYQSWPQVNGSASKVQKLSK